MKKTYITTSESETLKLGERIAKTLKGGEIIGLEGELGSGKSTLVRGIARGLGIKKIVTSPTFTIMNVYPVHGNKHGIKTFVHMDAYRLSSAHELRNVGVEDYIEDSESVVMIEWVSNVAYFLKNLHNQINIDISLIKPDISRRKFIFERS